MNQHEHGKHHGHDHHQAARRNTPIHKHWVTWVAIALMLGAMLMYVLSDDESLQPGAAEQEAPVEAAP